LSAQGSGARGRQRARELLVKALYQWQLAGHDLAELERQFTQSQDFTKVDKAYFRALLGIVVDEAADFDRTITRFAARSLEQLDAVGRAILLIALAELRHRPDVPTKVVINEAVELAKRYGAAESFKFVNAVLDKVAKSEGFRGASGGSGEGAGSR
jgi:transcription antitermination protein NusB